MQHELNIKGLLTSIRILSRYCNEKIRDSCENNLLNNNTQPQDYETYECFTEPFETQAHQNSI
jgi:hypothetical protein